MYLEIFRMGVGCGIDINIVKKIIMDLGFLRFFVVVFFLCFMKQGVYVLEFFLNYYYLFLNCYNGYNRLIQVYVYCDILLYFDLDGYLKYNGLNSVFFW